MHHEWSSAGLVASRLRFESHRESFASNFCMLGSTQPPTLSGIAYGPQREGLVCTVHGDCGGGVSAGCSAGTTVG